MTERPLAVVTGATGGIGGSIASRLAACGYDLLLVARDEGALRATVERLSAVSSRVEFVAADLSDGSALDEVARRQRAMSEQVELLVLAAGAGIAGAFADYSLRRLDLQLALNVRAPFGLAQMLLPALRSAASARPDQGSKVVAIASMVGLCGDPALTAYGASKAALISLCASITASEAEHGVTATAIARGYVDTDMSAWMRDRLDPAAMIRADDIAELVLTLIAKRAASRAAEASQ